jgi:hypothetical protein
VNPEGGACSGAHAVAPSIILLDAGGRRQAIYAVVAADRPIEGTAQEQLSRIPTRKD